MFSVSKVVLLLWYLNTLVWYQTLEFKFCRLEHPASPELWCRISNFFQQSFASNMFTCYNNRPHNKTLSRRNAKKFRHVIYSLCADPNVIILKTRFHRTVWFSSVRDSYGPLTRSTSTARVVSLPSQTAACCMLWVHDGWCHGSKVLGVEWTSGSSLSGSWSSSIVAPPGSLYISSNSPVSPLSSSHWPPYSFSPSRYICSPRGSKFAEAIKRSAAHTNAAPAAWLTA